MAEKVHEALTSHLLSRQRRNLSTDQGSLSLRRGLLGSLTGLTQEFDVGATAISGTIPSTLGALTKLAKNVAFGVTRLSGTVPSELGNGATLGAGVRFGLDPCRLADGKWGAAEHRCRLDESVQRMP